MCTACDGTGWKVVKKGFVDRCDCKQRKIAFAMTNLSVKPTGPDAADIRSLIEVMQRQARGKKRAMRWKELAREVFGAAYAEKKDRRIRALARAARMLGVPIASGNKGYFLATTPEDLNEVIRRQHSQAMKELESVRQLKQLQGQLHRELHGAVYDVTVDDDAPFEVPSPQTGTDE